MAKATPPTPSLPTQLLALLLRDEKAALLPDVIALLTYTSQNGFNMAGLLYLRKALVALETDAIGGLQQFAKDATSLILAYINAAQASPAAA